MGGRSPYVYITPSLPRTWNVIEVPCPSAHLQYGARPESSYHHVLASHCIINHYYYRIHNDSISPLISSLLSFDHVTLLWAPTDHVTCIRLFARLLCNMEPRIYAGTSEYSEPVWPDDTTLFRIPLFSWHSSVRNLILNTLIPTP